MKASHPKAIDRVLLLLIFLFPSSFQLTPLAVPIGDSFITFVEIFIFILLARWIADLIVSGNVYKSYFDNLFLFLLIYLAFSLVLGSVRFGTFKALGDFRSYFPLFLYFWVMRFFGNEIDLSQIRYRIFDVMIIVSIYVLLIFFFFRGAIASVDKMMNRVFFDNTLFLLIIYAGYLIGKTLVFKKKGVYFLSLLGLSTLMLLVIQARSYWVAFSITIGIVILYLRRVFFKSGFFLVATWIIFTFIITITFIFNVFPNEMLGFEDVMSSISERAISLVNPKKTLFEYETMTLSEIETIGTRVETAKVVWRDYVLENPLLGTGFGGELPMVSRFGGLSLKKFSIDNGYLTIIAKFGFIGLIIYGLIVLHLCQNLFRIIKSPLSYKDEQLLAVSFLGGIFAMLFASNFTSIFIRQQPSIVAFLFMLVETEVMRRNIFGNMRRKIPG